MHIYVHVYEALYRYLYILNRFTFLCREIFLSEIIYSALQYMYICLLQAPVPQGTCQDNPGAKGGPVPHLPNEVPPCSQGCHQRAESTCVFANELK